MTESMPADQFITGAELGLVLVSFAPWDKHTDNWADRPDELDCDCWHDARGDDRPLYQPCSGQAF
ncbi:hypothetical protein FHR25_004819 [Yokenella regensburgei]|nr:hypothetical protein FHR25_004819 [Yokenella regensburgei]